MIDKTFIEKIVELSAPTLEQIHGATYSNRAMTLVAPPSPGNVELTSLDSLIDIVKQELDKISGAVFIQAENEASVSVFTSFTTDWARFDLYSAAPKLPYIPIGKYIPIEEMLVSLNSVFINTEERAYLTSMLSKITESSAVTSSDDGVTQKVEIQKGIALKDKSSLRPIVELQPYRTFLEVEQPKSDFLVRIKEGGLVALIEADGGMWRLQAQQGIGAYLRGKVGELAPRVIILS